MFGAYPQESGVAAAAAAVPAFAWEVSLAIYLIAKGLKPRTAPVRTVPEAGVPASDPIYIGPDTRLPLV